MQTRAPIISLLGLLLLTHLTDGDDVPPSPELQKAAAAQEDTAKRPPAPPKPKRTKSPSKPAKEKPPLPSFTEAANAGPDFKTQGEYTGRVTVGEMETWYGVQIIALGNDEFEMVVYRDGLPGNDWNGDPPVRAKSEATKGGYHFDWAGGHARLREKTITVRDPDKQQIGQLVKVRRSSRTLGQKPPKGAVVLFDGSSVAALDDGQMTDDGLLISGFTTKRTFGDFTLHAEFRTPFMPTARGQQRGNSGIYMQGRYETQILDSFGLAGKNNEAGGIYEISDPALNMCFPPLSWQTYDVDFTSARFDETGKKTADARMTVKLNGVLVQDDVAVPRVTRASKLKEGPQPGPLYVQDHGNPVRLRNLWIVSKGTPSAPPHTPPAPAKPIVTALGDKDMPRVTDKWIRLFDGKTLDGWHQNPEKIGHGTGGRWTVEEGVITGEQDPPGSGNGGILLTDRKFGDFELTIDMKPDWGVCSGLFLRGTDTGKCFQMMVDYHDAGNVGHIYGEGTGGFANRPFSIFAKEDEEGTLKSLRTESTENVFDGYSIGGDAWVKAWKVGDWNTAVVRVVGQPPVITTWINGVKVSELNGSTFEHPKYDADAVAKSLGDKGRIAVQVHGGKSWPTGAKCRWRNIRINPLD